MRQLEEENRKLKIIAANLTLERRRNRIDSSARPGPGSDGHTGCVSWCGQQQRKSFLSFQLTLRTYPVDANLENESNVE